jgi:hypothetical protein
MRVLWTQTIGELCGDDEHTRAIERRVCDARHGVRRTGAQGSEAHSGATGQTRRGVCHKDGRRLVVDEHKPDSGATNGVEDLYVFPAGQTKYGLNPGPRKLIREDLCNTFHMHSA